ncbi:MAG: DUF423 domain-containing protein [Gammaproteobacteria bacterium]|nr:DUF423 domain-containing protein [Gammaproteobacteria bacterium]
MSRFFIPIAAALAFLGVALGAFGAHGLKGQISDNLMQAYQTGVFYHLVHALGLLVIGVLIFIDTKSNGSCRLLTWSGYSLIAGILLFSGSLYLMALTGIRWLGIITPVGGIAMLAAWILLFLAGMKLANYQQH